MKGKTTMFGLKHKHHVINDLIRARKNYDAALAAFLETFKGNDQNLGAELNQLSEAELGEFLGSVCEIKSSTVAPCRCRSEMSKSLLAECEEALCKSIASFVSTDVLGRIAAYESLPERVKAAARDRIQDLIERQREEQEAVREQVEESTYSVEPEPEEDYGRGRYCTGCGGC